LIERMTSDRKHKASRDGIVAGTGGDGEGVARGRRRHRGEGGGGGNYAVV
jgi:hypothetical protein